MNALPPAPGYLSRFLEWSGRYFKTDMRYLLSGSFWSVIAQLSITVISFFLAYIVSRYISKEAYGIYKYVLSTVALISVFSLNSLGTAVFQSTARGHDGALQEGFKINLRWSAFVFAGSLAFAVWYFAHGNTTLAIGMLVAGSLSPFLTSANLGSSFLGGKKDFFRQSIYFGSVGNGLPLLALIATIFVTKDPLWLILVYSVTNVATSLYFYKRTVARYRPDSEKKDTGMLSYAKHLSVIGILGGIAGNIDHVLLFQNVGSAELAIYVFAISIVDQAKGPLKNLDAMMQARFANHSNQSIRQGMGNKFLWLFFFIGISVTAYILIVPYLFQYLFPAYIDAVPYSQIYVLSLFGLVFGPASSYLIAKKKIREQYINSVIGWSVQIILVALGILLWGLWGLVIARVISRLTMGGLAYILYRRAIAHEDD